MVPIIKILRWFYYASSFPTYLLALFFFWGGAIYFIIQGQNFVIIQQFCFLHMHCWVSLLSICHSPSDLFHLKSTWHLSVLSSCSELQGFISSYSCIVFCIFLCHNLFTKSLECIEAREWILNISIQATQKYLIFVWFILRSTVNLTRNRKISCFIRCLLTHQLLSKDFNPNTQQHIRFSY